MVWRFGRRICHVNPEGFCGLWQIWQLWQVVAPSIWTRVAQHTLPYFLLLYKKRELQELPAARKRSHFQLLTYGVSTGSDDLSANC